VLLISVKALAASVELTVNAMVTALLVNAAKTVAKTLKNQNAAVKSNLHLSKNKAK